MMNDEHYLTVAEIARLTGYTEPQVRAKIIRGEIEVVRVGSRLFIRASALSKTGRVILPAPTSS